MNLSFDDFSPFQRRSQCPGAKGFGEDQDIRAGIRGGNRCAEAGNAAANDQDISELLRKAGGFEGNQISALGN